MVEGLDARYRCGIALPHHVRTAGVHRKGAVDLAPGLGGPGHLKLGEAPEILRISAAPHQHAHPGAVPWCRLGQDFPTPRFDDPPHDGEAQPGSAGSGGEVWLKYPGQQLLGDPLPAVDHR